MNPYSNPNNLPKVRSKKIMRAPVLIADMPCSLQISSLIPGHRCSGADTHVMAHLPGIGKGISTKTSDITAVCACAHCHDLLDRRDRRISFIEDNYPLALADRLIRAIQITLAWHIIEGNIVVPDGEII